VLDQIFREQLRRVRLLALDVDGVLTDGGVYLFEDGREFRRFNIKDGAGLKALHDANVPVAILSSGACRAIYHRAQRLGITEVHVEIAEKLPLLKTICRKYEIELHEVCYMGDDIADQDIMMTVGLPCAPSDALPAVKACAKYVTHQAGGFGAVRELCDLILEVQD
jgi:3-deoxy-D-manno-octulosonate 8-phosphate phosphatase (KDO 8-P phosphatase)